MNIIAGLSVALLIGMASAFYSYKTNLDEAITNSASALDLSTSNLSLISEQIAETEKLKDDIDELKRSLESLPSKLTSDIGNLSIKLDTHQCNFTDYLNKFDGVLNYTCPSGTALAGIYSEHDGHYEDRIFKLKCCSVVLETKK